MGQGHTQHSKQAAEVTDMFLVTATASQWYLANDEMLTLKEKEHEKLTGPTPCFFKVSIHLCVTAVYQISPK